MPRIFVGPAGPLPYRLHVPPGPAPPDGLPLLLFLHGAGERGQDNMAQLRHGVQRLAEGLALRRLPCAIVAPQCPAGQRWVEVPWEAKVHRQPPVPSMPLATALLLVDALTTELGLDVRRCYLVGLSMGGYGVWDAVMRRPDRFAAAVPICGGGDVSRAAAIARLPQWIFHGALDEVVPVSRSREMVAALRAAGGAPRYSEYPDEGHACWERACGEPDLLPWLLSQRCGAGPACI